MASRWRTRFRQACVQFLENQTVGSIYDHVSSQYWWRVWIIQEISLAQQVHVLVAGCTWTLSEIWALTFPLSAQMSQHVKEPNGLLDAESIGLYAARMSRRLGFYDRMQRDPMDAVKQPPSNRSRYLYPLTYGVRAKCTWSHDFTSVIITTDQGGIRSGTLYPRFW